MKKNEKNISVIGLGKLGLPFSVALASRGYMVYGVDINEEIKNKLRKHESPFYEPDLQEMLDKYGNKITIEDNMEHVVLNSFITFIVVATPSEKSGNFSLKYVMEVAKELGCILKKKREFHLVALISTVTPLSSKNKIIPELEKWSDRKSGKDFGFCYSPEFIALGSIIKNLLNPDFVLIGESDVKSGNIIEKFYKSFCLNKPEIKRMNLVNAEITKISLNSYVTMKISFANFLAELCEKTPEANVDQVTAAMGKDSRVGPKYFKGGLGFGGPCFPRDNRAIANFSKIMGVKAYLPLATDKVNNSQVKRIVKRVNTLIPKGSKIGVLGLSYKSDTAVVEESQAIMIAKNLSKKHVVSVYDPAAIENGKKVLGNKVNYSKSLVDCVTKTKAIILATPWKEFDTFFLQNKGILSKSILIDCWRNDDYTQFLELDNYYPLGHFLKNKNGKD